MKNKIKYLILPVLSLNLFFTFNFNVDAAMETNPNANYDTTTISCGNGYAKGIPRGLAIMSRNAIKVIKYAVPVVLIIMGIIDMIRAVSANDEKIMKEATGKFIRRIIAAVLVFFVIALLQFIFRILGNAEKEAGSGKMNADGIMGCINCFTNSDLYCIEDIEED